MKYLDYAIVGIHTVCYHDQGRRNTCFRDSRCTFKTIY